jgi:hypothetical protein
MDVSLNENKKWVVLAYLCLEGLCGEWLKGLDGIWIDEELCGNFPRSDLCNFRVSDEPRRGGGRWGRQCAESPEASRLPEKSELCLLKSQIQRGLHLFSGEFPGFQGPSWQIYKLVGRNFVAQTKKATTLTSTSITSLKSQMSRPIAGSQRSVRVENLHPSSE